MKDYTKEMIEITEKELKAVCNFSEDDCITYLDPAVKSAAERINALVQPVWYYPELGRLPEDKQKVWVILPGALKKAAILHSNPALFNAVSERVFPEQVIEGKYYLGRGFRCEGYCYNEKDIRCWTPVIVPAPPVEKGGEG